MFKYLIDIKKGGSAYVSFFSPAVSGSKGGSQPRSEIDAAFGLQAIMIHKTAGIIVPGDFPHAAHQLLLLHSGVADLEIGIYLKRFDLDMWSLANAIMNPAAAGVSIATVLLGESHLVEMRPQTGGDDYQVYFQAETGVSSSNIAQSIEAI